MQAAIGSATATNIVNEAFSQVKSEARSVTLSIENRTPF